MRVAGGPAFDLVLWFGVMTLSLLADRPLRQVGLT